MNKPDKTNDKPNGRPEGSYDEDSLPTRLAKLEVGQTESRSVRLNANEATPDQIRKSSETLSGGMRKAISRTGDRSKGRFTTETGYFISNSRVAVITCVATRIK